MNTKIKILLSTIFISCISFSLGLAVQSVSGTMSILIAAPKPLVMTFSPSSPDVLCGASSGSIVSTIYVSGGTGKRVIYGISGDTGDFALSSSNVVVGPNGININNCGSVQTVTVTATQ